MELTYHWECNDMMDMLTVRMAERESVTRCIDSRFGIGRWKQLSDWQIWQNATEVFV